MKVTRMLEEGYGSGAWHGPDLKAALVDVSNELAHWRPGPDRHSIAEIAVHHAYCVRSVLGQLTGKPADPFILSGEDWFSLSEKTLAWPDIQREVDAWQARLAAAAAEIEAGRAESPLSEEARDALGLGISCHAVYHAGQIQLIKRLHG